MINIDKFIKIRKSKKISQNELSHGICTQSTLSKFENNGQVPSFKILKQLCDRMGIEVGDIIRQSSDNPATKNMFEAEFAFITYDYNKIRDLLSNIQEKDLKHEQDRLHFDYLRGLYALDGEKNDMTALYYFNNILSNRDIADNNIYRLLALNGCSQIYASENDMAKAHHYYDQILSYIKDIDIDDELTALQVLAILCDAGEFFGKQKEYKKSNSLLRYAYSIASEKHTVYFLARILFRWGLNDIEQGKGLDKALQHLYDACAFARLNKNHVILTKAKKLIKELNQKNVD
ncbi:helix-turn-helix domain-containing protein [Lactobacillus intestinalis]|uniref:helix-turn-helix domain-containing protein n=1 Tax=Lactobacillus intestinalis TaxID=151781 RepID=UPI001F56C629|nr:helix-turn-helix transcriptional regulator [Lactobacillus intestinalis]